ncbi:TauD/TfdA family dioxygenase [Streptomyces nogalater]
MAGLRMDMTALADPEVAAVAAGILLLAVAGKFLGAWMGAAAGGLGTAEALACGAGMNARGVIEVIVAMTGLRLGVLNATAYTTIVLVAIVTSLMAPPCCAGRWTASSRPPRSGRGLPGRPSRRRKRRSHERPAPPRRGRARRPPLPEFTALHRDDLRARLSRHGAVLLRGFSTGPDQLRGVDDVVRAFSGPPLEYAEQSSPRTALHGNIYTSTDYPPDEEIFLHNENSYQATWPGVLFFTCVEPPSPGGDPARRHPRDIPLDRPGGPGGVRRARLDGRTHLPAALRRRLADLLRHRGPRRDRPPVRGPRPALLLDGRRRAAHRGRPRGRPPAPGDGESVWFNHITFFHGSTLPPDVREGLLELFGDDGLPANSYYGDGGTIPDEVVAHLRDCYRTASRRFDWRRGDVLLVDNMLAAHGREPFTGPRRIAVAMAEPVVPAVAR